MKFGNTLALPDVIHGWSSSQSALLWSTFFGVGGQPLFLAGSAADEWVFSQAASGTQDIGIGFNVNGFARYREHFSWRGNEPLQFYKDWFQRLVNIATTMQDPTVRIHISN